MTETKDKLVTLEDLKTALDEENSSINDMTTGINLLRGTRDFVIGRQAVGKSAYFKHDGFYWPNGWKLDTEENFFASLSADVDISISQWMRASVIERKYIGNTVTLSGEIRINNQALPGTADFCRLLGITSEGSEAVNEHKLIHKFNAIGIDPTKIGEWQQFKSVYDISVIDDQYIATDFVASSISSGISLRKLKLEEGNINNPIWSPSPFDIDYINDETTGINLLRGTRDFTYGTTYDKTITSDTSAYIDGWKAPNNNFWKVEKDSEGYSNAVYTGTNNTTAAVSLFWSNILTGLKAGDKVTLSYEYMLDELGDIATSATGIQLGFKSNTGVDISDAGTLFYLRDFSDLKTGIWYKVSYPITVGNGAVGDINATVRLRSSSTSVKIRYRKVKLELGSINNPIWSPSPFDVTQEALAGDSPIYNLGSMDVDHQIQSNDDLDEFLTPGTYACVSDAIAKTLSNCPTQNAFKLYVYMPNGNTLSSDYRRQILVVYNEYATEYIRFRTSATSGWSSWRQTYANTTVRPIEGGGTGEITARASQYALLNESRVDPIDAAMNDNREFIMKYINGGSKQVGAVARITGLSVWNWIASKIRSVFGFTADNKLPASRIEGGGALPSYSSEVELYACTPNLEEQLGPIVEPIVKDAIKVSTNGVTLSSDIYNILSSKTVIMDVMIMEDGYVDIKAGGSFMLGRYDIAKLNMSSVYAIPLQTTPNDIKLNVSRSPFDNNDNGIGIGFYTNDGAKINATSEDHIVIEILV